jgi:Predicted phosphatases
VRPTWTPTTSTPGGCWRRPRTPASARRSTRLSPTTSATERRAPTRLPCADELADHDVPLGVCSLNCEDACRTALERHDILDAFGVVAGRDTVPARKPDPRALTWVIDELGVEPENTLFVGDSPSDETTANRAGTAFRRV